MSILDKVKRQFDMAGVAVTAIELVRDIAQKKIGGNQSAGALLDIVAQLAERVIAAFSGGEDPRDLQKWVTELRASMTSRSQANDDEVDDVVDEIIDDKFDKNG